MGSLLSIGRMLRVSRPAIAADRGVITALLDLLLGALVMVLAQALQRAVPEQHLITMCGVM